MPEFWHTMGIDYIKILLMTKIRIKPKIDLKIWVILIAFMSFAIMMLASPFFSSDWTIKGLFIMFSTFFILMMWGIDRTHLTINFDEERVSFKGYFGFRSMFIEKTEFRGYSIHQRADQLNGYHEEYQIIHRDGKIIHFPKIAYPDYYQIKELCEKFDFVEYQELKYGAIIGKVVVVMGIVSGILAALVGLLKFL